MMNDNPWCLYDNNFTGFLGETEMSILGKLVNHYHGEARTTTIDAWKGEINIMRQVLSYCDDKNGRIIFEYDIPRLGKRIDIVLLYKGIIFCVEFINALSGDSSFVPPFKLFSSSITGFLC